MGFFGIGGSGSGGKAAAHSADVARQSQEFIDIVNGALGQLAPGSDEYNQMVAFGDKYLAQIEAGAIPVSELGGAVLDQQPAAMQYSQQLIGQQQKRIASGEAATPAQAATNKIAEGLKSASAPTPIQQDILNILGGKPTTTPIGGQFAAGTHPSAISQELLNALQGLGTTTQMGDVFTHAIGKAASPTVDDTVFQGLLKQVEDKVNTSAAGRGILGGGLRLEQLGRAGVEAATTEAQRQDQLQQQAYSNALGLFNTGQQTEADSLNFAGDLYNAGNAIQGNQIDLNRSLLDLQLGRENSLTSMLNANSQRAQGNLTARLSDQAANAQANADAYATMGLNSKNQLLSTLGSLGGTLLGGSLGGPVGASIGGSIGSSIGGGGGGGSNVSSLLASKMTNPIFPGLSQTLSRNPSSSSGSGGGLDNFSALLKLLGQGGGF